MYIMYILSFNDYILTVFSFNDFSFLPAKILYISSRVLLYIFQV